MQPASADETRPLWQQVLDDLERRLASGEIVDRFPTDRELCEHYGVSRHTVREAVRRLRARGLVERHRGRGSFVNDPRLVQPLGGLYSLYEAVERQGLAQHSEVLFFGVDHDADAAVRLGLRPDAELVRLQRVRHAGDEPLALDSVWLPADVGRPLLEVDFSRTALYDELRARVGVRITAADESLEPVVPDDDARALLHLAPDEALLRVRRLGTSDGRPVECRVSLIRGQRFVYTTSWQAEVEVPATSFKPS
ncbi:MAG TPA: GntR family transcriptional regulator [Egicoccus sp.]|nr:GntR family transcriptional regulator [Egicoccus sp.]HSK25095.1 GntR family transcriptional regulator [Egicoccus sp.]